MKAHILILILGVLFILSACSDTSQITNYEECVAAGNRVMMTYPGRCRDPISDRTFTEEIKDSWKLDGIGLRQHETEMYFGCFGCSNPNDDPGLCVDPIQAMKEVKESEDRYCNEFFEVVESEKYVENIGESCNVSEDCKTPMEYLIQSNCPFGSACIDSECKVVCPLAYHDPNPEISKSYSFVCEIDDDCDCSERENRTLECVCLDNTCVSVET
jgi:hypothetical protein